MNQKEIENRLKKAEHKICCLKNNSSSAGFTRVGAYNELPNANLENNKFFYVENSQGIKWLPGNLGGTYYPKGFYYSNGVEWIFSGEFPIQATLPETNTGSNNERFITPYTLKNASQWGTKSDVGHNHDERYYTESEVDNFLVYKADANHNHDSRYYTETEINNLLANINTGTSFQEVLRVTSIGI